MIQIEALPDPVPRYCTTCMHPLTWVYVHHLQRNVAVVPLDGPDRFSFRIHTCSLKPDRTWRYVETVPRGKTVRGRRQARLAAAAATQKLNEKEQDR